VDLVQVYAVPGGQPGGGLVNVVDQVDLTIQESAYTSDIKLTAGTAYTLALCPRSKDNGGLSDQVEGQYWETFCIYQPFTTYASAGASVPNVNVVSVSPAVLQHGNQITVAWSSYSYTDGQVLWGPTANPNQTVSNFVPGSGTEPVYSGQYTANISQSLAGKMVSFTVQVRNTYQDANLWFKAGVLVRAASNYTSLTQFLAASNVYPPTGVRQYIRGSLRAKMEA
jgi:hypothetical protein